MRNWNKNIKIKICGLTRECDIDYANEARPDYIGFVFAKSRRQIGRAEAEKLKEKLDGEIKAVGVFVDAPMEEIISLVKGNVIDMVQLHGRESPLYVKELKEKAGCGIIKAFHPEAGCQEREVYDAYREAGADYFLFDSGGSSESIRQRSESIGQGSGFPNISSVSGGGTGRAFCWDLIPKIPYPYFLAGGIGIENVEEAIRTASPTPYGLDISSGVETDGFKDREKILEIIREVRKCLKEDTAFMEGNMCLRR